MHRPSQELCFWLRFGFSLVSVWFGLVSADGRREFATLWCTCRGQEEQASELIPISLHVGLLKVNWEDMCAVDSGFYVVQVGVKLVSNWFRIGFDLVSIGFRLGLMWCTSCEQHLWLLMCLF